MIEPLTDEIRRRIEQNRLTALSKLARVAARPAAAAAAASGASSTSVGISAAACSEWYPSPVTRLLDVFMEIRTPENASFAPFLWEIVLSYLTFYNERIGIFVHWGVYAVPAFDSVASAQRRRIQNGSEWYAKRLSITPGTPRPTSGWQETQQYHRQEYGDDFAYSDFKERFTAEHWRPDEWMAAFKHAGASYAILTSKHHDGFCLWPTTTSKFSTAHAATARFAHPDLVAEFKQACARAGLRFGLYYSWSEFGRACTKDYMDRVVVPQIDELIRYRPTIVWFDGDWPCNTKYAQTIMDQCVTRIKQKLPGVEINDRVGHSAERKDPNFLGPSTYRVYDDRALPTVQPAVPWEHVNTIGLSWGRNKQQTDAHYKSGQELMRLYTRVTSLNGRFCLNVGPDADGQISTQELSRLRAFAQLLP